ncbi:unnamed protein product [Arctogadus glacialis]
MPAPDLRHHQHGTTETKLGSVKFHQVDRHLIEGIGSLQLELAGLSLPDWTPRPLVTQVRSPCRWKSLSCLEQPKLTLGSAFRS